LKLDLLWKTLPARNGLRGTLKASCDVRSWFWHEQKQLRPFLICWRIINTGMNSVHFNFQATVVVHDIFPLVVICNISIPISQLIFFVVRWSVYSWQVHAVVTLYIWSDFFFLLLVRRSSLCIFLLPSFLSWSPFLLNKLLFLHEPL